MSLANRVVLVTGAGRGIGRAIALELARLGAAVAVNARHEESAAKVAAEIIAAGGRSAALAADVSDFSAAERLVQQTVAALGRVDILVNNAGITRDGLLLRMREDDWNAVLDTNLKSVFNCTRAVCKIMMKERWGRIVNITSVIGLIGNVGQANYAASKAGVIGFTKSSARELASRNITVNAVAPGFIETEMTAALPAGTREKLLGQVPLGRLGTPEDVASLVAYLASDGARYITGQVVNVDGGMVM